MIIRNYTPHAINIINENCVEKDEKIRKYVLKEGVDAKDAISVSISPAGRILNVTFKEEHGPDRYSKRIVCVINGRSNRVYDNRSGLF